MTARAALSVWLVEGRQAREMTREHVARVTRIPMRTLDSLEEGRWDELPADVFVRGFLRSYARCVGLSVEESLARYSGCGFTAAPVASAQAQALLDTMATLAPSTVAARPMSAAPVTNAPRILAVADAAPATEPVVAAPVAIEVAPLVEAPARKRTTRQRAATIPGTRERDAKGRFVRKSVEMAAVVVPEEARAEAEALDAADRAAASAPVEAAPVVAAPPVVEITPIVEATLAPVATPITAPITAPMRVTPPRASRAFAAPSLVIDDDHPEDAERTREERARAKDGGWRSFLPPALLDQERGSRQGGLTLAVIILLIVATLTLSYLMRRPSSTGEGITRAATPAAELG
ncbi:MAG: helix-turn-helix domain-containing protein [Myxococcales bacterium]|nr:helix-turn-helix domain-containing protein [Myxococcales bacterium]